MSSKIKRYEITYTYMVAPYRESKAVVYATSERAAKKKFFESKKERMDNLKWRSF